MLVGHYQFVSQIGKGGMGVIYKCRHPILDKFVAIKMLRQCNLGEEAIRRFQLEAKAASKLNHPNLISVYDFGVTPDGHPYMVMDFLEGKTLYDTIREGRHFSLSEIIDIFVQCCDGLIEAHKNNVLHRDIKSSNIILTTSEDDAPRVKIVDFGIAKILRKDEAETLELTKTGDIFGSPLYMSPEQGGGNRRIDHRTDIYSLGCVLFETLTGAPPFLGTTAIETLLKHLTEAPPTLKAASLGKEFPPELESLVMRTLSKDPSDRPNSMVELRDELSKIKDVLNRSKPAIRIPEGVKDRVENLRLPWEILGFTFIAVLIVGIVALVVKLITPEPVKPVPPTLSDALSSPMSYSETQEENDQLRRIKAELQKAYNRRSAEILIKDLTLSRKQFELLSQAGWIQELTLLRCDNVSADGLQYLKRLKLRKLSIVDSDINDQGLAEISEFAHLTYLNINQTRNTSWNGLSKLAKLKNLRNLLIASTQCADSALEPLYALRDLRELDVSDNPLISDHSVEIISRTPSLSALHLRNTSITNEAARYFLNIEDLKLLDLSGNKSIGDPAMSDVARVKRLEHIWLNGTSVTGKGLLTLKGKKTLKSIQSTGLRKVTRAQWSELVQSLGAGTSLAEPIFE